MPVWKENTTEEDFKRKHEQWRKDQFARAKRLRDRAEALIAEADRIEARLKGLT